MRAWNLLLNDEITLWKYKMMLTENSALLHSMFFVNAEQIHGVFGGAEAAGMPVIVQVTPTARNYINHKFIEGMIKAVENIYPSVNLFCYKSN